MKIVPLEKQHIEQMNLREPDARSVCGLHEQLGASIEMCMERGHAYAAVMGNEIAACGGVVMLWPGVAEAWLLTTPLVEKHPMEFAKKAVAYLYKTCRDLGLWRVQCVVLEGYEKAIRFVEWMAFEREGLMKKYGRKGESYWRYALIREVDNG